MKKIIILLCIMCPFLCSCTDATEPETLGYVVAIGIDSAEDEDGYNITLQFANPSKISGDAESGGEGGSKSVDDITVLAPGIYPAVNLANHIISKKFVLSHTKVIVFSDEIAKKGIGEFLEAVGRSSDIRPNTYFTVCEGKAKDFLAAVNPETEVNPVRYYTMIFENDYSGFIPQYKSQDFYFYYNSDEKNAVMPICSIKKDSATPPSDHDGYQEEVPDYIAGEIQTNSKEIQVMGTAIFDGDTKISEIRDIETEIFNLLSGRYKTSFVSYEFNNEPVTVLQTQRRKPKITVDTSQSTPKISVKLYLEVDLSSGTAESRLENEAESFSREAEKELKKQTEAFLNKTTELGCDIVGFGSFAKQNFMTNADFSAYKWKEKYKNAEFDVSVDLSVRRTGLIVRSK